VPGQSATGLFPDEVVLLPIIGGDLSIPLLEGTVEHGGTVAFEQGGIRVAVEDLVFDLTNSVVTGLLGFLVDRVPQFVGQVTLFDLRSCLLSTGSDPCRDDDGSTLLNGFGLDYSDTLAMFLNDAFGTTPLGAEEWLVCTGLASIVLWADESRKLVARLLRGPTGRR